MAGQVFLGKTVDDLKETIDKQWNNLDHKAHLERPLEESLLFLVTDGSLAPLTSPG